MSKRKPGKQGVFCPACDGQGFRGFGLAGRLRCKACDGKGRLTDIAKINDMTAEAEKELLLAEKKIQYARRFLSEVSAFLAKDEKDGRPTVYRARNQEEDQTIRVEVVET
jgi:hypothetical protein